MTSRPAAQIHYGGDYNPEQWPREIWDQDYAAFDLAGINTLTVGVFAWAHLQPAEDRYDFSTLDAIVERASAEGRQLVLATPSGAMPPWLAHAHPDACRVDFDGRRHVYGQRHNACPSSPAFRRLSVAMAGGLAERYASQPAIVAWHVGNEYGGACWCELCGAAFHEWLQKRYGDLDRLNAAWNTTFWSHTFTDWAQVPPPNALSEHWRGPNHTAFQGITLDYKRFMSDALLGGYLAEKAAIRAYVPHTPVTTNFMGLYQPIDYHRWAPHLDFVAWDNYPPAPPAVRTAARMALAHGLMRGLRAGQPFWVMEQTPSVTACRDVNPVKRPGVLRLWSWQSVAHGADAVLYFQMRQSRGASEKYHGAVLDHAGRTDTRVFREVSELGKEFQAVGDAVLGARTPAKVALLVDWDSWWAVELSDGPNRNVRYLDVLAAYHRALWQAGVPLDVVPVTADLSGYSVVVGPLLHLVKGDLAGRVTTLVEQGGSFLTTALSGRVDEDDNAFLTDAPGAFGALLGLRIDETDAQQPSVSNPVTIDGAGVSEARHVFEVLVPTDPALEVRGTYGEDFYAGTPAVTRTARGRGSAWYVGTLLDDAGVSAVVRAVLDEHGLTGPLADVPEVEVAERVTPDGVRHVFLLHHSDLARTVPSPVTGTDLLTGRQLEAGEELELASGAVLVIRGAADHRTPWGNGKERGRPGRAKRAG